MGQQARQWKDVVLPSKGYLYDGQLPEGRVKIAEITMNEEQLIAAKTRATASSVPDIIYQNCVNCAPMNPLDLLVGDRLFLLFSVRSLSFGSGYHFPFRCSQCGTQSKIDIDLSTGQGPHIEKGIRVQTLDEDAEPTILCEVSGGTIIELKRLTGRDEKTLHSVNPSSDDEQAKAMRFYNTLIAQIASVDGKSREEIGIEMRNFLQSLPYRDSILISETLEEKGCGLDTELTVRCPSCGWLEEEVDLPLTSEFFRPRIRGRV